MNIKVFLTTIFLLSTTLNYGTQQMPDLLIIEQDTIELETYPLEELWLMRKFKETPFVFYGDLAIQNTGCRRGYVATWKIIANKLVLFEIKTEESAGQKLNIKDYLKNNGYYPKLINGHLFADWYSDSLKQYPNYSSYFKSGNFSLAGFYPAHTIYPAHTTSKNELIFNNGILTQNNIARMDSYKVGDTLTKEICFYTQDFLKRRVINLYGSIIVSERLVLGVEKVHAIIMENNGRNVKVKIVRFETTNKNTLRKIRRLTGIKEENEYWINPRFWD